MGIGFGNTLPGSRIDVYDLADDGLSVKGAIILPTGITTRYCGLVVEVLYLILVQTLTWSPFFSTRALSKKYLSPLGFAENLIHSAFAAICKPVLCTCGFLHHQGCCEGTGHQFKVTHWHPCRIRQSSTSAWRSAYQTVVSCAIECHSPWRIL